MSHREDTDNRLSARNVPKALWRGRVDGDCYIVREKGVSTKSWARQCVSRLYRPRAEEAATRRAIADFAKCMACSENEGVTELRVSEP